MSDLADFLLARIAEDEAAASGCDEWDEKDRTCGYTVTHKWARITDDGSSSFWSGVPSPRRVLAECDTKRQIIAGEPVNDNDDRLYAGACDQYEATLRLLALPYADHPDYREEWP